MFSGRLTDQEAEEGSGPSCRWKEDARGHISWLP